MSYLRQLALATLFTGLCGSLYAVDGVVLIDQNRALAGGVTPGDTPGFPVTISQTGSYRLTGNLTVPDANTSGIVVTADHVTIDLNGFSIIGPGGTGTGNGVFSSTASYVTVKNGGVSGMGHIGLFLDLSASRVDQVIAEHNGDAGIFIVSGSVLNSVASFNGGNGISAVCPSLVVNNETVLNNAVNIGIGGTGCTVVNNVAP